MGVKEHETARAAVAALERCARDCTQRGWRFAYTLLRHREDAQDAVQQAYLVAVRKAADLPVGDPWPWFAAAIANEAANLRRRRARRGAASLQAGDGLMEPPYAGPGPEQAAHSAELAAALSSALDELPEAERDAVVLTQVGGLTYEQASKALGVPLGTFNHRASRGLAALRQRLRAGEPALLGGFAFLPVVSPPDELVLFASQQAAALARGGLAPKLIAGGLVMKKLGFVVPACLLLLLLGGLVVWSVSGKEPAPEQAPQVAKTESPARGSNKARGAFPIVAGAAANDSAAGRGTAAGKPGAKEPAASAPTPATTADPVKRAEPETTPEPEWMEKHRALQKRLAAEPELKPLGGSRDPRIVASLGVDEPWLAEPELRALRVGPDGSFLIAVSADKVSRFETTGGSREWAVEVAGADISDVALSPDGAVIALALNHHMVLLLRADNGARAGALPMESSADAVAFHPDGGRLAVACGTSIALMDLSSARQALKIQPSLPHTPWDFTSRSFNALRYSADGARIAAACMPECKLLVSSSAGKVADSADDAAFVAVFQATDGELLYQTKAMDIGYAFMQACALSSDCERAVVEAIPADAYVLSQDAFGSRSQEWEDEAYRAYLATRPNPPAKAARLAVVVHLPTGKVEHVLECPLGAMQSMQLALDENRNSLAVWQGARSQLYDYGTWAKRAEAAMPAAATAMAIDPSGRRLYANNDNRIVCVNANDGSEAAAVAAAGCEPDASALALSPDGSVLLFEQDGAVVAWEIASRRVIWRKAAYRLVDSHACLADGSAVACIDSASTAPVHLDLRTGELVRTMAAPEGMKCVGAASAPINGTLVSTSALPGAPDVYANGGAALTEFVIWRAADNYQPRTVHFEVTGPFGLMGAPVVSEDGRTAACPTWKGLALLDIESGTVREATLEQGFMNNTHLEFTPDGKELWVCALMLDFSLLRIDVAKGQVVGNLKLEAAGLAALPEGGEREICSVLVSRDSKTVLVALYAAGQGAETMVRVDVATGQVVDKLPAHAATVEYLSQSADGRMMASLGSDRVLHVWRLQD